MAGSQATALTETQRQGWPTRPRERQRLGGTQHGAHGQAERRPRRRGPGRAGGGAAAGVATERPAAPTRLPSRGRRRRPSPGPTRARAHRGRGAAGRAWMTPSAVPSTRPPRTTRVERQRPRVVRHPVGHDGGSGRRPSSRCPRRRHRRTAPTRVGRWSRRTAVAARRGRGDSGGSPAIRRMGAPGHFPDRRWRVDVEPDTRAHAGSATLADPLTGRLLDGRYRIGQRIARGGMAAVYEAVDIRLDRVCAVKTMHRSLGRRRGVRRPLHPRGPGRGPALPPERRQRLRPGRGPRRSRAARSTSSWSWSRATPCAT